MTAYSSALVTHFNGRNTNQRHLPHPPRPCSYQSCHPSVALPALPPVIPASRAVPAPAGTSRKPSMVARRSGLPTQARQSQSSPFPCLRDGLSPPARGWHSTCSQNPSPRNVTGPGSPRASLRLPSRSRYLQPRAAPDPWCHGAWGKLRPRKRRSPVCHHHREQTGHRHRPWEAG